MPPWDHISADSLTPTLSRREREELIGLAEDQR